MSIRGDWRVRIETEREQLNPREFPKTLTPCARVYGYHACPSTRTYNSLNLLLNSFSSRTFVLPNSNPYARISFFLFSLCNAQIFCFYFFYEIYYLHQNLTLTYTLIASIQYYFFLKLVLLHADEITIAYEVNVTEEVKTALTPGVLAFGNPETIVLFLAARKGTRLCTRTTERAT